MPLEAKSQKQQLANGHSFNSFDGQTSILFSVEKDATILRLVFINFMKGRKKTFSDKTYHFLWKKMQFSIVRFSVA